MNDIEAIFWATCTELGISATNQGYLRSLLAPLRDKSEVTNSHYLHSLRVGLLAKNIGGFIHHEERPLLFAGTLHDLGKCQTSLQVLGRNDGWGEKDQREIEHHVLDGYRLLRGRFNFSAETILWHHRFQEHGYPEILPPFLRSYRQTTQLLIREYGRIVAIADVFDALHRVNAQTGGRVLTSDEIRDRMFLCNPDRKKLISALYASGILS